MSWTESFEYDIFVAWLEIDVYAPIRDNAEIYRATFKPRTVGLVGGGYFDSLAFYRNLYFDKVTGAYVMYYPIEPILAGVDTELPVFGAVFNSASYDPLESNPSAIITAAHIVPQNLITGDNTDYCQLQLLNKETDNLITTLTLIGGNDAPAYKVTSFGGVSADAEISIFEGVSLNVVHYGAGLALPYFTLVVEYNLN